ncbi:MAG: class I adenylate-forming enzyme family protein [Erysipelotrichaceae bacterium]|nr:class I adenylate-forming enzyme family protein [Erysipelotrichaceae bacterium]
MERLELNIKDTEKTIVQRIFEHGSLIPEKTAIIVEDRITTYADLCRMISSYADILKDWGVKKGDRVIVQAVHDERCVAMYYAVHLLGAILVPVEKNAPEYRVNEIGEDVEAVCSVSLKKYDRENAHEYDELSVDFTYNYPKEFPSLDDPCEMVFTTGTTGKSKGVLLIHKNISWYAYTVAKAVEMKKDNRFFITTPLNHAGGMRRTHLSLANGCCVVYLDGLINIKKYFEIIEKYEVTSLYLPPVAIRVLINTSKDQMNRYADRIDFVYSSSSSLPVGDCAALRKLLPDTRLYNAYEASETPGVSVYDYNCDDFNNICMGKPNDGVEMKILTDEGMISDSNVQGQICVKSPMNMLKYYGSEELTASVMKDGWFVSNDLGQFNDKGEILYLGRKGDVINIAGYKIAPTDVEEKALLSDMLKECICIEDINAKGFSSLKLLVVPKDKDTFNAKELISFMSNYLEPYKLPKSVDIIDEVNKTFNGKIDRKSYRK